MAKPSQTIEELVVVIECVVRVSKAAFGYVFELAPDMKTFSRGRPVPGTISDVTLLRNYYKQTGNRALELLALRQDQAILVTPPNERKCNGESWFATIITQKLGVSACVAIVYPFYDEDEAVRTLRLVEMILTTEELR